MESYGAEQSSLLDPTGHTLDPATTQTSLASINSNHFYYLTCFAAGGMSSSIRWFMTPLEVVKTQLQLHPATSTATTTARPSSWRILQTIYRNQGVPGLYRGVVPTAASYGTQTSIKYGVYEYTCSTEQHPSWKTRLAAAFCAEAIADVCMCPFEAWKVRVQAAATTTMTTTPSAACWWTSWTTTLGPLWARQVPGTVANFLCFEAVRDMLTENEEESSIATTIVAGCCAGACSAIVSHPADVILSLRATSATPASVASIVATHGLWRLATRGLGPRIVLTSNVIALQWLLYDQGKRWLLGEHSGSAGQNHSLD